MADPTNAAAFNTFMLTRTYVSGYAPTKADAEAFSKLSAAPKEVHALRWYNHIASFADSVRASWPEASAEAEPVAEEEDDDDSLFGSDDDDEAAAALQAKMAADAEKAKAKKVPPPGRSLIVLEVKPFDAETDLQALALNIKKLEHEGIQNWGAEHKLVPVAYGVNKLVISAVVWDDKCGVDDLTELINELYEDDVQSIDVAAFSKV